MDRNEAQEIQDEVMEAIRLAFVQLPTYSFLKNASGAVVRQRSKAGDWVNFQDAHELFDAERVDGLLAKLRADRALTKAIGGKS